MVPAAQWRLEDKHVSSSVSLDIIGRVESTTNNKSHLSVVDVNNKHNT